MSQKIIITRHGNRQDFVDRNWRRNAEWPDDPPLSEDGIVQARELGQRLLVESIGHIFCSPFLRTVQTAHQIAEILELPVMVEPGLSEWHNADWFEIPPVLDTTAESRGGLTRIDTGYLGKVIPDHPETFDDVRRRVAEAVELIVDGYEGNLLLVGHGASVQASAQALAGTGWEVNSSLCCLIRLGKEDGRWVVEINGDTSHLSSPERDSRLV